VENQNSVRIQFKNQTVQKFDICLDGFLTETARSPQFRLKSDNYNFTCIQCTDKERFKTPPKQSLAYRFFY